MSPFLRGGGADTSSKIKGLLEFSESCMDITISDKKKFDLAIREHDNKNYSNAIKIYKELLREYENNDVIKYNLKLIEKK